jgi:hypothetical protein
MLACYNWQLRHAGLMAIAAIGEGTSKVLFSFSFILEEGSGHLLLYIYAE